jgi:hypothetical protein
LEKADKRKIDQTSPDLSVFPVGLALYARASPKGYAGIMVPLYYLNLFAGNLLVVRAAAVHTLARSYDHAPALAGEAAA